MGWKNWQKKAGEKLCAILTESFHVLTHIFLSISYPLSFLLLARLSCFNYLSSISSNPTQPESTYFLLHINPAILYLLVSMFGIATLVHGLTDKFSLLSYESSSPAAGESPRHRLYTAWILLSALQVCVRLGIVIEGSIAAGIDALGFDMETNLLRNRIIFFLGLHETMLYWSRTVVKPVVDNAVFGFARNEKWVQRVTLDMSFGSLWWWRLKDEVEYLVIVAEAKIEMLMGVSMVDLHGWLLYYLTVTIGMVRIVKGLMWVMTILLCRRVRCKYNSLDSCENDDKV